MIWVSYGFFIAALIAGAKALHLMGLASRHLKPSEPAIKAWIQPISDNPALYTERGRDYLLPRQRYTYVAMLLLLIGGTLRLYALT